MEPRMPGTGSLSVDPAGCRSGRFRPRGSSVPGLRGVDACDVAPLPVPSPYGCSVSRSRPKQRTRCRAHRQQGATSSPTSASRPTGSERWHAGCRDTGHRRPTLSGGIWSAGRPSWPSSGSTASWE
ncbi:hypothetical protein, conserved [Leishmania tarentolae]|nr:hypothetical protein, conserved [Leishmania tarentolae]